ncbi:MAG: serine hydrolase [Actinobacteria bacterium]|nr:serine hydrolase [Actinomycetota bacterium]
MSGGTPTGSVGRGFAVIAVAAAAAALMTGCGSSTGADPAANESALPFASPPVEGNPAEHSAVTIPEGQIDRAVESLDAIVDDVMAKSGVPGVSVAVVHEGDTVFLKGFGVRELGNPAPVDENTVFQLASLSKPVGATVVSSVVSDTDVTWDDPVTKYLPTFALADPYVTENVTLADLYSHRSGLPDHAGDLLEDLGFNQTEILTKLRLLPLEGFRSQFLYTNFGLTAAAEAVAASQGTSWARLSAERLYEPLGMTATSSDFIAYETAENKAVTHQWIDGSYQALEVRDPQAQSPAGGVSSTAADMAKWLTLQLDEGEWEGSALVAPEVLQQSREPHILSSEAATAAARPGFYALGIGSGTDDTGRVRLSHSGAFNLGASTTLTLLPAEDLGIVVLTNGAPQGAPEAIAASFLDIVETGEISRDWQPAIKELMDAQFGTNPSRLANEKAPATPSPSPPLDALSGTYSNDYYGPMQVVRRGESLVMVLGPKSMEFPLTHWSGTTYSYEPRGENAVGISAVTFAAPVGGESDQVTVEFLNADGLGTFVRE